MDNSATNLCPPHRLLDKSLFSSNTQIAELLMAIVRFLNADTRPIKPKN